MGHTNPVRVLLVGDRVQEFFATWQVFDRNDCECQFAKSHQEVTGLHDLWEFDIVLCTLRNPGESIHGLIALLLGSRVSVFCSLRVEEGYWWLPVLRLGKECLGMPAFRPADFIRAFDQLVEEIKANMTTRLS